VPESETLKAAQSSANVAEAVLKLEALPACRRAWTFSLSNLHDDTAEAEQVAASSAGVGIGNAVLADNLELFENAPACVSSF
jgi:hypothetical protein